MELNMAPILSCYNNWSVKIQLPREAWTSTCAEDNFWKNIFAKRRQLNFVLISIAWIVLRKGSTEL